jgi:hypothetical protein
MNIEDIEKFLEKSPDLSGYVKVSFKQREAIYGQFVKDKDHTHLKAKNFWRIVTKRNLNDYLQSKDLSLTRIFNGAAFSRLTRYEEVVD